MRATHPFCCALAAITFLGVRAIAESAFDERQSLYEQWHTLVYPEGKHLPVAELDYERITAIADRALRLAIEENGLWKPVHYLLPDGRKSPHTTIWYERTSEMLSSALLSAPTSRERRKWAGEVEDLAIRFLKEPRLQHAIGQLRRRVQKCADSACGHDCFLTFDFTPAGLAMYRRSGTQEFRDELNRLPSQDLDYTWMAAKAHHHVTNARMHLKRDGLLHPDDWGVQAAFEWWKDGTNVQKRGKAIFLTTHCLRKLGIPVRMESASVVIGLQRTSVRLPVSGKSQASAFKERNNGSIFVPIDELERVGLVIIERTDEAQLVKLFPGSREKESVNGLGAFVKSPPASSPRH